MRGDRVGFQLSDLLLRGSRFNLFTNLIEVFLQRTGGVFTVIVGRRCHINYCRIRVAYRDQVVLSLCGSVLRHYIEAAGKLNSQMFVTMRCLPGGNQRVGFPRKPPRTCPAVLPAIEKDNAPGWSATMRTTIISSTALAKTSRT